MMQYHEQMKHPNWQKKRLEVLEANGFTCEDCGAKDQELHVHHPYYKRGAMIWQYEIEELQCLCHKCHTEVHAIDEKIKQSIALLTQNQKMRVLGFSDAMTGPFMRSDNENYLEGFADELRANTKAILHATQVVWGKE